MSKSVHCSTDSMICAGWFELGKEGQGCYHNQDLQLLTSVSHACS